MKRIFMSILTIALVSVVAIGATKAYFSDTETSTGNTFTAGTLDLTADGNNGTNTVKFTVTNMVPGNQPKGTYALKNVGTVNGFLDIENVSVSSNENGILSPEAAAGDTTGTDPGAGELGTLVNARLFVDRDGDGWVGAGDTVFYNGTVAGMPSHFELSEAVNAGATGHITAIFDWWSSANDNLGQGDDMTVNMTFELAQTAAQ